MRVRETEGIRFMIAMSDAGKLREEYWDAISGKALRSKDSTNQTSGCLRGGTKTMKKTQDEKYVRQMGR